MKKLAWTIWNTGLGSNALQWQPETQGLTAPPTRKRGAGQERPAEGYQKKKQRKEVWLIPGGARMQSLIEWYVNKQANKDNRRGQKRNARLVA